VLSGENTSIFQPVLDDSYSTSNVSIYSRGISKTIQPYIECSIKCNQSKVYLSMKMNSFYLKLRQKDVEVKMVIVLV
jgi:hypothetical protein